jgi:thiamine phosphate synthase YjbQ (UPF0047 family)
MMEAVRTSETLVKNYFTRQYIPEDNSELHTRRRENLKSHVQELLITLKQVVRIVSTGFERFIWN